MSVISGKSMPKDEEKEMEVTKHNSLIRFEGDVEYKDLAPVFSELYTLFMDIADQYPEDGGEEYMQMLIRQNLKDLKNNSKPTGHNREARYRMIFPLDVENIEFFLYPRIPEEESEIEEITSEISNFLDDNDLEHEIIWDEMEYLMEEKD
ncbi:MAG: hypothetical protein KGY76_08210 [Candidatus Thermoplasmatota archaeon]|nr:hypothetical protein [Candidatus Thermoplasmatota archaeon]